MVKNEAHETEYYKRVLNTTSFVIQRALRNNRWLLSKHGRSAVMQRKDLLSKGIKLNSTHENELLKGNRKTCNMTYLGFYATYWEIDLIELMCRDYGKEEQMEVELKHKQENEIE